MTGTLLERLYRILRGLLIALVTVLLLGSLYGLMKASAQRETVIPLAAPRDAGSEESYFTGLGRIRAQTADPKPAAVVVSIVFPYDKQDRAFTEELSTHLSQFREIAVEYFSSQSALTLKNLGEDRIKAELLIRFNRLLRLGSIKTLHFNDYMIIE